MVRINKSKTFVTDCTTVYNPDGTIEKEYIYAKDFTFPLQREIFAYLDNILQTDLCFGRIDDHGDHSGVDITSSITSNGNYQLLTNSLVGWYVPKSSENEEVNMNTNKNILVLEVAVGPRNATYTESYTPTTGITSYPYFYNINLYYSRTYMPDGQPRRIKVSNENSGGESESVTSFFYTADSLINSAGIRTSNQITTLSSKIFKTQLDLQIIKNSTSTFLAFNTYENGLPRVGRVLTGINNQPREAFIFATNNLNWRDDNARRTMNKIMVFDDDDLVGYYTSNILNNKHFVNSGNNMMAMTMYPGFNTTDSNPTTFNLEHPIAGFLQTTGDFANTKDSRYIINNNSYTNLGSCILMHD